MADQTINLSFSMKEIFDFIPEISANSPIPEELTEKFKNKEFSLVFELDDEKYSLISKNITDITTANGDLEDPMVRVNMTMADLVNLIKIDNASMFLGRLSDLGEVNNQITSLYDNVSSLKGKVAFELTNKDDSKSLMNFTLNNQETPSVSIKMEMDSFKGLVAKEDNPINLFMSGKLKLEGDMALAMSLQTLIV